MYVRLLALHRAGLGLARQLGRDLYGEQDDADRLRDFERIGPGGFRVSFPFRHRLQDEPDRRDEDQGHDGVGHGGVDRVVALLDVGVQHSLPRGGEFEWLSLLDEQDTRAEVLLLERDRYVGTDGVAAVAPLDDERRLDVRLRVRPEPFRQRVGRPASGRWMEGGVGHGLGTRENVSEGNTGDFRRQSGAGHARLGAAAGVVSPPRDPHGGDIEGSRRHEQAQQRMNITLVGDTIKIGRKIALGIKEEYGLEFHPILIDVTAVTGMTDRALRVKGKLTKENGGVCRCCAKTLTDDVSKLTGIGPVCSKYVGVAQLNGLLKEEITNLLSENNVDDVSDYTIPQKDVPHVIMVVGVNGVGKTTTIGKLAHQYNNKGYKVVLGAADTFRAAAVEQLTIWAERVGVTIIKQAMGSDPASVAFDTLQSAKASNAEVVLIDTAGRLHNKVNLMNELSKIKKVMQKVIPDAPHEILLVLDGSTGQNAIEQAEQFIKTTEVNSLALTKLDGTAKGGVVIGISDQFKIPVKFIGVGEGVEQLQVFNRKAFIDAMFEGSAFNK